MVYKSDTQLVIFWFLNIALLINFMRAVVLPSCIDFAVHCQLQRLGDFRIIVIDLFEHNFVSCTILIRLPLYWKRSQCFHFSISDYSLRSSSGQEKPPPPAFRDSRHVFSVLLNLGDSYRILVFQLKEQLQLSRKAPFSFPEKNETPKIKGSGGWL